MKYKYGLILILPLMLLTSRQDAAAQALNLELQPFSKGNYLLAKGRYQQAAAHWHQLSVLLLSNPQKVSQQQMWQSAGLAASLAAIAADKSEDPIAYQYWADSTRYLLTGGTNWSQIQQQLHQRLETANTQLSVAMQVTDVISGIDENLDIELTALQLWDEKLNLFSFTSPKLGLNRYDTDINNVTNQPQPVAPNPINSQQHKAGKKLSGYESNFSHTPSFTPTPSTAASTEATTAEPQLKQALEKQVVDSSDADLASAAQTATTNPAIKTSTELNTPLVNPLGIGNANQPQDTQVESLQKRQIEPIPQTDKPVSNELPPSLENTTTGVEKQ